MGSMGGEIFRIEMRIASIGILMRCGNEHGEVIGNMGCSYADFTQNADNHTKVMRARASAYPA